MKNERIRGLNRNLNDGWYFRKLEVISQVGPFCKLVRNLIRSCEIGFWSCEMAHVWLGGVSQVAKIFTSWIVDLRDLALRISQVGLQLWNWILKLRNGTRVPRRCFTTAIIFTSWIVDLRNLALRISQVGPHFHKLKYCSVFLLIWFFMASLQFLWNSFWFWSFKKSKLYQNKINQT